MKFGFLIDKTEVECDSFSIVTLPNFEETLKKFYETVKVSKGWIYGSEIELEKSSKESINFKQNRVKTYSINHRMPLTHKIETSIIDDGDHLRFLILGYGFLQGLYLSPENYSYLGKVPYEPGTLNSLVLVGDDRKNGMEQINNFYKHANQEDRKQAFAVIHWFLFGQSYTFGWDKFDAQYKVLDGIYKLSGFGKHEFPHFKRPIELANKYKITLPKWAELNPPDYKDSTLTTLRNQLVHESKYADQPIGYAHTNVNYALEFVSFNTKLICGVLGIDTPYLLSKPDTRDRFAWDIKKMNY